MNIEDFYNYCISKPDVTENFPFDKDTLVFKVKGKMFALTSLQKWEEGDHSVNLKCDPDYALELRSEYEAVQPGYHMHKKHWNTVSFNQDVSDKLILELVDHSYELVSKANKKK
jgi:predicted DNA-binding protein (MmcQ/YjbR family)